MLKKPSKVQEIENIIDQIYKDINLKNTPSKNNIFNR